MDKAIIKAEFTDYRPVKTRKTVVLSFEIPAEAQAAAFAALGYPVMGTSIWVAIAKLAEPLPSAPQGAPEGPLPVEKRERKRSEIAALKCKDNDFQDWIISKFGTLTGHGSIDFPQAGCNFGNPGTVDFDHVLKRLLGIESKRELDTDPFKAAEWDKLITSFEVRAYAREGK